MCSSGQSNNIRASERLEGREHNTAEDEKQPIAFRESASHGVSGRQSSSSGLVNAHNLYQPLVIRGILRIHLVLASRSSPGSNNPSLH
jgi:hypothetical protein